MVSSVSLVQIKELPNAVLLLAEVVQRVGQILLSIGPSGKLEEKF